MANRDEFVTAKERIMDAIGEIELGNIFDILTTKQAEKLESEIENILIKLITGE